MVALLASWKTSRKSSTAVCNSLNPVGKVPSGELKDLDPSSNCHLLILKMSFSSLNSQIKG